MWTSGSTFQEINMKVGQNRNTLQLIAMLFIVCSHGISTLWAQDIDI